MDAPLVSALDVGFAYGRKAALDGFCVDVRAGRIALLLGLNGAGKSTALALLAGKTSPREGRVRICGSDPRRARARRDLSRGESGICIKLEYRYLPDMLYC